jgi:hypothetical protein
MRCRGGGDLVQRGSKNLWRVRVRTAEWMLVVALLVLSSRLLTADPGALRSLSSGLWRCEIDWPLCAHNNRLPLAGGHSDGSLSGKPTAENPNGVTKKAMQLSYLLP